MQASPSLLTYWKELVTLLAGSSVVTLFVARAVFDVVLVSSLDRCKAQLMDRINSWYAARIAKIDGAVNQIESNTRQLQAFQENVAEQNRVGRERADSRHRENVDTLGGITETLGEMKGNMERLVNDMVEVRTYLKTRDGEGPFGTRAGDNPAPRARKPRNP